MASINTFTIVGNVDLDALKPLVEKYIGSIPVSKKAMTFADDKCAPVKGDVTEEFTAPMQQPKSRYTTCSPARCPTRDRKSVV